MPDTPELGPGEVARSLRRLEEGLAAVNAKLDNLNFVRTDVWHAEHAAINERITAVRAEAKKDRLDIRADVEELKNSNTWVWRAIMGGVITLVFAVVTAIVLAGVAAP